MIKRIPRKNKQFTYEGETYGIRPATAGEVQEVTRMMAAYQRSIKSDIKQDVIDGISEMTAQIGDVTLMTDCQLYVAKTLVIDIESEAQYFSDGTNSEDVKNVPAEFIIAAWNCYTNRIGEVVKEKADPQTTDATTTLNSDETSSTSLSSSTSTPPESEDGSSQTI